MEESRSLYIPLRGIVVELIRNYTAEGMAENMIGFVYSNIADSKVEKRVASLIIFEGLIISVDT